MARLKDEKRRTPSSRAWLERQISDPYVARAKREGLRSRAAFKLAEIDDKARLFKPGARVVDLGAAPGGWSEVATRRDQLILDEREKEQALKTVEQQVQLPAAE